MISCSCFGRRPSREPGPEDREPLLQSSSAHSLQSPRSQLEKAADVVAAIQAGKLPSQEQINRALQTCMRTSCYLRVPEPECQRHDPHNALGPLSDGSRRIIEDVRNVLQSILEFGVQNNDDNRIQDILFGIAHIDSPRVHVDTEGLVNEQTTLTASTKDGTPSAPEVSEDIMRLLSASKTLFWLLLTSLAVRFILYDLLWVARQALAEIAGDVSVVAGEVQAGAEEVEKTATMETSIEGLVNRTKAALAETQVASSESLARLSDANENSAEKVKLVVVQRLQDAISEAHSKPEYASALRSALTVLQKYADEMSSSTLISSSMRQSAIAATPPDVYVDDQLKCVAAGIKVLLERAASGRSLDPIRDTLEAIGKDFTTSPKDVVHAVDLYLVDLNQWLESALADPQYVTSRESTGIAGNLYDRVRAFVVSETYSKLGGDLKQLLNQISEFIQALQNDRATSKLLQAAETLSSDIRGFGQDAALSTATAQRKWREEIVKDLLSWVLPRLLRSLRVLPMPRVEYSDSSLDLAIDALLLTSTTSLSPDHITVQNWNELSLNMYEGGGDASGYDPVTRSTRLKVHVDGVRFTVDRVGYYVAYKGILGYEDEGLLSISVGEEGIPGEGISLDIDLETSQDPWTAEEDPLYTVHDVKVSVPGLKFSLDRSRHWILNKLLVEPLAGLVVRRVMAGILQRQIRSTLETFESTLSSVSRQTRRDDTGSLPLREIWATITNAFSPPSGPVVTEAQTAATLKGIVRTSTVTSHPGAPSPQESTLAIGVGPQLFTGKGDPSRSDTLHAVLTGAVDDAHSAVRDEGQYVQDALATATGMSKQVRRDLDRADERMESTRARESSRQGWKSSAFDL
ncbi:hypothetical protein HYDPIDRAFT_104272, partial [Hydnomerulius pinastri MD-312]